MKWWYWLILELLIIFGVIAWIYFFPSEEFEGDFAKAMFGFVLLSVTEECKDINRRKTMDYKKVMICGECLKYEYCPVANHNTNHKACMKITTEENYTVEQNAGENQIEDGVVDISGSVKKTELKEQLESYEGYINDIPLVIDPCKMCKYIDENKQSHIKNTEICRLCCWYYDSRFEIGD